MLLEVIVCTNKPQMALAKFHFIPLQFPQGLVFLSLGFSLKNFW